MSKPRTLRRVGCFRELGYDHADAPCLAELRGQRTALHKQEVVGYLRSGRTFVFSPGLAVDVFDGVHAGKQSLLTDGTHVWPGSLAHYVERYDVALPEEFEAFMSACGWAMPRDIDLGALALP
jgi:hypothetical protein